MSRRSGVVTAFVHAVDPEQGRVKVEYRAIEDDLLSTWAPVATPLTGGKRGQLFMPEVGDECLVAFENGDFDHPYVLGFLWNGKDVSPERQASNRVIVTPGGHQLRFEDKQGDRRVILRSDGKHELQLEDTSSGPFARLKTAADRHVLLDDTPGFGKIEITSGQHTLTLDDAPAGTKIAISAGMGVVTLSMNVTPVPSLAISVGGNSIDIGPAGVTVNAVGALSVAAAGPVSISSAVANVTSSVLNVNAAVTSFSGIVTAPTVVAGSVVSPLYTPGVGNLV
jgi:phage baseplate assembly protein V